MYPGRNRATILGDERMKRVFQEEIEKTDAEIAKQNRGFFVFLRASPYILESQKPPSYVPVNIRLGLRNELRKTFEDYSQWFHGKTQVLNWSAIEEYFINKNGCRMLTLEIQWDISELDYIPYEDQSMGMQKISFDELESKVFPRSLKGSLDEDKLNFGI